MNARDILEGYLNEMVGVHKEMSGAINNLLSVSLSPFEALFIKDDKGKRIVENLGKKEINNLIDSLNNDLVPLFKESGYDEGLEQVEEWMEILEKNLEEQK